MRVHSTEAHVKFCPASSPKLTVNDGFHNGAGLHTFLVYWGCCKANRHLHVVAIEQLRQCNQVVQELVPRSRTQKKNARCGTAVVLLS